MSARWRTPGLRILAGLLCGLAVGLVVGWVIWPLRYYDTDPINLRPQQKAAYIALTGLAYGADQDLDRARVRLYALGDPGIPSRVRSMANEYIKYGDDPAVARGLAMLAKDLGVASFTITDYLASPTPSPSLTPTVTATATQTPLPPTPTPSPSMTRTATLSPTPSGAPTAGGTP
jgi:hypothetical protein